jgi:hypothetical protein
MHLTEADINPVYIRDFLGHTDLKVTQCCSQHILLEQSQDVDHRSQGIYK